VPEDWSSATLRIEPHAIPAVRMAYEDAASRIGVQLIRLSRDGTLLEPWLGDETSQAVHETYNRMVMEAPEGPYAAMVAYQAELVRIRDQLRLMEDAYRRTEGDNSERWGRA
jgi:uncharacterized protein YukE